MSFSDEMGEAPSNFLNGAMSRREAYGLLQKLVDAHQELSARVTPIAGDPTAKAVKPRVRVGAKSFVEHRWGGTYETTDGVNYRLVEEPRA